MSHHGPFTTSDTCQVGYPSAVSWNPAPYDANRASDLRSVACTATERTARRTALAAASTTWRSSPPTWTRPCASTSACSACASSPPRWPGRCATTSSRWRRGNTVAFFEVEGAETFAKPAGGPTDRAIQLDHISFDVPDEHALEMLRKRLLAAGSEVTDGRRPRLHPLGVLHRPERHRARGVVVGRRRHRPPDRLQRPRRCSATPTRSPRSPSCAAGGIERRSRRPQLT